MKMAAGSTYTDYAEKIMDKYRKMMTEDKLLPGEALDGYYRLFQDKFGPQKLGALDGEALLETLFNQSNKDSLVYWLEFKNDDEFPTRAFGGIGGGSAYKFGIFKRKEDEKWVAGSTRNAKGLTREEAVQMARAKRDILLRGAEIIGSMPGNYDDETYINLDKDIAAQLGEMANLGWVHKYYHLLFPDRICTLHSLDMQRHYLIKIGELPVKDGGRYAMDGRYMRLARQLGLPVCALTKVLMEVFGPLHQYWRVGTTDTSGRKSYWEEMLAGGYISIGWPEVGDLEELRTLNDAEAKKRAKELLERHYPAIPQYTGKSVSQLLMFVREMQPGDIVVAARGQNIRGIGRITGGYEYRQGLDFPHCRKVEWLVTEDVSLPQLVEGLQTTVYKYKDDSSLLAIESAVQQAGPPEPPLPNIIARIENILKRKKQVILYGPPGTGKTYWAEKACLELASRKVFNRPYEALNDEQRRVVRGEGDRPGLVRMCTFHPSYSYEDFIEGIKPRVVNGQTLFEIRPGIFWSLCEDARNNPEADYYLIIDEINRGDISRIFGELITVMEAGKRGKNVTLPLSGQEFSVPGNVYIVGTMNTADRSIALLDIALRRRFGFIELMPDYSLFEGINIENIPLGLWLQNLNSRIQQAIGKDGRNLQIGHAYFIEGERPVKDFERFCRIVHEDVIPLLEEYCYEDYDSLAGILGNALVDINNRTIRHEIFLKMGKEDILSALLEPCPEIAAPDAGEE